MASASANSRNFSRRHRGCSRSPPRAEHPRARRLSRLPVQNLGSPPDRREGRSRDSVRPPRRDGPEVFQSSAGSRGGVCTVCLCRHGHPIAKCDRTKLWNGAACGVRPEKRAGSAGRGRWPRSLLRLATPKGVRIHQPRRAEQVLRLRKGSRMRSSGESLSPLLPIHQGKLGRSSWQNVGWTGGILSLFRALRMGLMWGYPASRARIPPNHPSINSLPDVYNSIMNSEFEAGRYIGPCTRNQPESALGPFQTSPLSLVPETLKPGVFRAVHNFSHLHNSSPDATSINSHIDCDDFPCTWGTFSTVALLIALLPPGSRASIRDVAEAYRTMRGMVSAKISQSG